MSLFLWIAIAFAVFYMFSTVKKYREYKKLNPTDVISLTEDNQGMRNICGVFLFFMIITSGVAIFNLNRLGFIITNEITQIVMTLFFFVVLYIPLSSKTRVSSIGIYRNASIIYWKDVINVEYLKANSKGRLKVKVIYKSYDKPMTIELVFKKKMMEYEALKNLVKTYMPSKKEH